MAPKPTGKPGAGKKPSNQPNKKGDAKDAGPKAGAPAGDNDAQFAPPKSKDEVMAQISFDGLPTCPTDQIVELFSKKYVDICKVFAHYCKYGECKTMDAATRLRMGASPSRARPSERTRPWRAVWARGDACQPACLACPNWPGSPRPESRVDAGGQGAGDPDSDGPDLRALRPARRGRAGAEAEATAPLRAPPRPY